MSGPEAAATVDYGDLGDLIERLAKIARAQGVSSLSVKFDNVEVSLSSAVAPVAEVAAYRTIDAPLVVGVETTIASTSVVLTAPMVGTFYAGPGPNEPPFVAVGDPIEQGQTIGIIEAMKIMNEIPAERSGTVVEILVQNGQAVEYGSPLFRIEPSG
jgi:acetyl-CoA carboxylase biotin carboxyl carrier protein